MYNKQKLGVCGVSVDFTSSLITQPQVFLEILYTLIQADALFVASSNGYEEKCLSLPFSLDGIRTKMRLVTFNLLENLLN